MGLKAPSFVQVLHKKMIAEERVQQLAREKVLELGGFLVSAKVSTQNEIQVFVDKAEGISITECLQISRFIEEELDREIEDFQLLVSSPGLNKPFVVKEQYLESFLQYGHETLDFQNFQNGICFWRNW